MKTKKFIFLCGQIKRVTQIIYKDKKLNIQKKKKTLNKAHKIPRYKITHKINKR